MGWRGRVRMSEWQFYVLNLALLLLVYLLFHCHTNSLTYTNTHSQQDSRLDNRVLRSEMTLNCRMIVETYPKQWLGVWFPTVKIISLLDGKLARWLCASFFPKKERKKLLEDTINLVIIFNENKCNQFTHIYTFSCDTTIFYTLPTPICGLGFCGVYIN